MVSPDYYTIIIIVSPIYYNKVINNKVSPIYYTINRKLDQSSITR